MKQTLILGLGIGAVVLLFVGYPALGFLLSIIGLLIHRREKKKAKMEIAGTIGKVLSMITFWLVIGSSAYAMFLLFF